jgi:hypothetical protein
MTTGTLPPATADRLAKLCGLLGSSHDGERANAAALADRLLREHGLAWETLVGAARLGLEAQRSRSFPVAASDAACARRDDGLLDWLLRRRSLLSEWEAEFLSSLRRGWSGRLTRKQAAKMRAIWRRVAEHERSASCAAR